MLLNRFWEISELIRAIIVVGSTQLVAGLGYVRSIETEHKEYVRSAPNKVPNKVPDASWEEVFASEAARIAGDAEQGA